MHNPKASFDCVSDVDDDNDIETDNEEDKMITDDGVVLETLKKN